MRCLNLHKKIYFFFSTKLLKMYRQLSIRSNQTARHLSRGSSFAVVGRQLATRTITTVAARRQTQFSSSINKNNNQSYTSQYALNNTKVFARAYAGHQALSKTEVEERVIRTVKEFEKVKTKKIVSFFFRFFALPFSSKTTFKSIYFQSFYIHLNLNSILIGIQSLILK